MNPLSKILVIAGDEPDRQALAAEVTALAGESAATVTLLGVHDPMPDDPDTRAALPDVHDWTTTAQQQELTELCTALQQAGVSATMQQVAGKPFEEIIRAAIAGGFDLVMKPAANEGDKSKFFFGSTDMQLFRLSPVPVWIFKPTAANKLARVMIAVDLLEFDKEKSALADKITGWGKHVADAVGAELHVLHIWDLHQEFVLRRQAGPGSVDRLLKALESRHRQWLRNVIEKNGLDPGKVKIHFKKGDAEGMIAAIARAHKIDLLVMGTVGRTGIPGFFIGNTADSVLRQVNCSVLAIKPDGFRTPIKI